MLSAAWPKQTVTRYTLSIYLILWEKWKLPVYVDGRMDTHVYSFKCAVRTMVFRNNFASLFIPFGMHGRWKRIKTQPDRIQKNPSYALFLCILTSLFLLSFHNSKRLTERFLKKTEQQENRKEKPNSTRE